MRAPRLLASFLLCAAASGWACSSKVSSESDAGTAQPVTQAPNAYDMTYDDNDDNGG
jgi:hypothetical protein